MVVRKFTCALTGDKLKIVRLANGHEICEMDGPYSAIQVDGEDVNGECMFAISKNGKFTSTYVAAQTRGEAVQRYKKFLE